MWLLAHCGRGPSWDFETVLPVLTGVLIWLGFIRVVGLRRIRHTIPWQSTICGHCRYDMSGHPADAACPECGTPRAASERHYWTLNFIPERRTAMLTAIALSFIAMIFAANGRLMLTQLSFDLQVGFGRARATEFHAGDVPLQGVFWTAMFLPLMAILPRPWWALAMMATLLVATYAAPYVLPYI